MAAAVVMAPHALAQEVCGFDESVLEFIVNSQVSGPVLPALRDGNGELWLTESAMTALRLSVPGVKACVQEGERYYPLSSIEGSAVRVDESLQRAYVEAPASALSATRLSSTDSARTALTTASNGAFLNYQLSAQHAGGISGGTLGEAGIFGKYGVLTSTGVARYSRDDSEVVRLDTTFTRDFPDTLRTLTIGDAVSDAGSYGNSVRFGGLRLSRNFALRPDLLTMPLLTTGGTATVPSTVDVLINNRLVSRETLPPGPFVIDRLPAVSGAGEISVVVRDALGRETVTTRSFYASTSLLARGLTQYAVDLGSLRDAYGIESSQYGALIASGTYRHGLSDSTTLEGHAELGADRLHNSGLSLATAIGHFGVMSGTLALGGDSTAGGWLGGIGFEQRGRRLSVLANFSQATEGYRELGDADVPGARRRSRMLIQSGVALGRGSVALAYARETFFALPARQTLTLSHSLALGKLGMLSATAVSTLDAQRSTAAFLMFTACLDSRRSLSMTGLTDSGSGSAGPEVIGTVMQNTLVGPSTGYRASASSRGEFDLTWDRRFDAFDLQLEGSRFADDDRYGAYASGAVTLLDGQFHFARSVTGSFAVIDLGDLPGVPVYLDNQPVGRTDESGRLILPDLRPYEPNRVSIQPEDIPLDTAIDAPNIEIAPPFRSGVVARFPLTRIRHGTFRLILDSGAPVPAGASVDFNGRLFAVLMDGFVYVTNFDHGLSATAAWRGGRCRFRVEPPPAGDPMPDMGTIRCRELLSADTRSGVPDARP